MLVRSRLILLSCLTSVTKAARNPYARTMSTGPPASASGIDLYSVKTPNGIKINIAFEELISAGVNLKFKETTIDFSKNEQKEPWFLEINPNGRIPAIIDHERNGKKVWESGSILLYLAKHYDTKFALHFDNDDDEDDMITWIMFGMGGYGPMAGQAGHFLNAAPEKIVYGAKRYIDESKRLLSVYESRLSTHSYLVGNKFSYADIAIYPWLRATPYSLGIAHLGQAGYPKVQEWMERIEAREGTKKALEGDMISKMKSKDGWEEDTKKRVEWVYKEEEGKTKGKDEL